MYGNGNSILQINVKMMATATKFYNIKIMATATANY